MLHFSSQIRNKIISYILIISIIVPLFFSSNNITVNANTVDATATTSEGMIQAYLSLSSGKKLSAMSSETAAFTSNDLKVLGLFLSNFYTPFGSSLEESTDGPTGTICMDILVAMGFEMDAAKTLLNMTFKNALGCNSVLYYSATDLPGKIGLDADEGVSYTPCLPVPGTEKFDTYLQAISGSKSPMLNASGNTNYYPMTMFTFWCFYNKVVNITSIEYYDEGVYRVKDPDYEVKFYKVHEQGSVIDDSLPVFKMNRSFVRIFGDLLTDSKSFKYGLIGNAMFNGSEDDFNNASYKPSTSFALTPFGQKMYVDWVGNIFVDSAEKRLVVVPAVLNPCCFVEAVSDNSSSDNYLTYMGSSFGQRIVNNADISDGTSKLSFNILKKKIDDFFTLQRNKDTAATWDTSSKWFNAGWGGEYRTLLDNMGIEVPGKSDNKWNANSMYLTAGKAVTDNELTADKYVWDYLHYDTNKLIASDDLETSTLDVFKLDSPEKDGGVRFSGHYKQAFTTQNMTNIEADYDTFIGVNTTNDLEMQYIKDLFITYVVAFANGTANTNYGPPDFNVAYNHKLFPEASGQTVWETTNTTQEEVLSFLYMLLHPQAGIGYFITLIKTKIGGLFLSWHEDIVGNTSSNVTTGMTKYVGFSGYITVPSLNDISFLEWLVTNYDVIVLYLIIIMFVILLCYVLIGQLTLKRAIAGILLFAVLAFLPNRLINTSINLINNLCNTIYSSKFDYWAIVQNEEYLESLNNRMLATGDTTAQNIVNVNSLGSKGSRSDTFGSTSSSFTLVKVKWQGAKKNNDVYKLANELRNINADSGSDLNMALNIAMGSNSGNNEVFVQDATYLYRDYMDIYSYAVIPYNCYTGLNNTKGYGFTYKGNINTNPKTTLSDVLSTIEADYSVGISSATASNENSPFYGETEVSAKYDSGLSLIEGIKANNSTTSLPGLEDTSSLYAIQKGFLYSNVPATNTDYYGLNSLATTLLVRYSPKIVKPALENYDALIETNYDGLKLNLTELKSMGADNTKFFYGIDNSKYNYSINDILADNVLENASGSLSTEDSNGYSVAEKLGYLYSSLYEESPFYFFNFNFRDQLKTTSQYRFDYRDFSKTLQHSGAVRSLFLANNSAYFLNMYDTAGDGYGYIRDYMNMHDFFYYVIPILRQGNKTVRLFDDLYSIEPFEDVSYRVDASGTILYNGFDKKNNQEVFNDLKCPTEEHVYKLWHNMNLYTIFNLYTPWLDLMYDCDYAKPETITVAGKNFEVTNPLDPTSYFTLDDSGNVIKGRYMVFSESEQHFYGLKESDLTQVERKIIKVQKNVYNKALNLMNYYTFNDEVLIQAFTMVQLFEFNKEFSQKNFISATHTLYPQGFELKTFSYDAYLRLILSNSSTAIDMMTTNTDGSNEGIYAQILKNTSIFFGLLLILNDLICVYVVPLIRFVFICLLFVLSVFMIIAGAIKLYDDTGLSLMGVIWASLVKPLLQFAGITMGLAILVSLFMYNGPTNVTKKGVTISLGDPTMTVIALIIMNCAVVILYWKLMMQAFRDLIKYVKAVLTSISGTVKGALGSVAKGVIGITAAKRLKALTQGLSNVGAGGAGGAGGDGGSGESAGADGIAGSADSRGKANASAFGASAMGAGVGAGLGAALAEGTMGSDAYQNDANIANNYNQLSQDSKDELQKSSGGLLDATAKEAANYKSLDAQANQAGKAYDDYKAAKAAKRNKTHVGKFDNSKNRATNGIQDLKNGLGVLRNSNASKTQKGMAMVDVAKGGVNALRGAVGMAGHGVLGSPRLAAEKVGQHLAGKDSKLGGILNYKENKLLNNAATSRSAAEYSKARLLDLQGKSGAAVNAQLKAQENGRIEKLGTAIGRNMSSTVINGNVNFIGQQTNTLQMQQNNISINQTNNTLNMQNNILNAGSGGLSGIGSGGGPMGIGGSSHIGIGGGPAGYIDVIDN